MEPTGRWEKMFFAALVSFSLLAHVECAISVTSVNDVAASVDVMDISFSPGNEKLQSDGNVYTIKREEEGGNLSANATDSQDFPGAGFGVMQLLDPRELNPGDDVNFNLDQDAVWSRLQATETYVGQLRTLCDHHPDTCEIYSLQNVLEQEKNQHQTEAAVNDIVHQSGGVACVNQNPLCTLWAVRGDCNSPSRKDEMNTLCAPACMKCVVYRRASNLDSAGADEEQESVDYEEESFGMSFGEAQVMHYSESIDMPEFDEDAAMTLLEETGRYMMEMVGEGSYCWNGDKMCTVWAVLGECESNPEYMLEDCAPACQSCEMLTETEEEEEKVREADMFSLDTDNGDSEQCPSNDEVEEEEDELTMEEKEMLEYDDDFAPLYVKILHNDRVRGGCHELDHLCQVWTERGACKQEESQTATPPTKSSPWHSCKAISTGDRPGTLYGVEQDIQEEMEGYELPVAEDVYQELEEIAIYMDMVQTNHLYPTQIREACRNFDSMCTLKAMVGICDEDPSYMIPNCGPSCGACGHLLFFEDVTKVEEA